MRHSKIYRKWWVIAFCITMLAGTSSTCMSSEIMIPENSGLDATRSVPRAFTEGALTSSPAWKVGGVFFDAKGKEFTFEDFKDKVLVLVFWAHWSLDSLTLLSGIQKLKDHINLTDTKDMIEVLPVSGYVDGVASVEIEKIGTEHGLKMPLYFDREGGLFDYFGVRTVPLTFIVDKDGKISHMIKGYMKWDSIAVMKQLVAIATTGSGSSN